MKPGNLIKFIDESLVEVVGLVLEGNPLDGYRILVDDKVLVVLEIFQAELVAE